MKRTTKQWQDKLTGLISEVETQPDELLPTWSSHIGIPLVQNIVGGLFVAAGGVALCLGVARGAELHLNIESVTFWNGLVGILVASAATTVRFFGDDLGLITAAYDAGLTAADDRINGLVAENQRLLATVRELRPATQRAADKVERIDAAQADAETLLTMAHNRQPISREKVAQWCPQRRHERAIQLLKAAGTMTQEGQLVDRNLGLSLQRLQAYTSVHKERTTSGNYVGGWELNAQH